MEKGGPGGAPTPRDPVNLRKQVDVAQGTCARCREDKNLVGRGLCNRCHIRCRKDGTLDEYVRERRTFADSREIAKASETPEGCWPWPHTDAHGYPTMVVLDGDAMTAHVASWTVVHGPVPDGRTLDHRCHSESDDCAGGDRCRHRRCIRPDHLEPVTPTEQQRRRPDRADNTCGRGHILDDANTSWQRDGRGRWYRQCRPCNTENHRDRRETSS